MKARVTEDFPGKLDKEILPRVIAKGEIIDGDLARVAIENKWAVEDKPAQAESKPVDEKRSYKGRGNK